METYETYEMETYDEHDRKQRLILALWQTLRTKYRKRVANLQKNYKQNSIVLVGDQFNGFFLLIQALGVDKF